ncbi:GGDEF domain-containing protein [Colwelliaceae bacterium 6441]
MKISLSQRITIFTMSCCLLFIFQVSSIIWSSKTIELAYDRANYAQKVKNHTNNLKQLVLTDNIYANNFNADNWLISQKKFSILLNKVPHLTAQQQTIQNSITSQNTSVKQLFSTINKNQLQKGNDAIRKHLRTRLITQLETIRSDALELETIVEFEIYNTIKQEVIYVVMVFLICIIALLTGAFNLIKIFNSSLAEVTNAFKKNHSGHFQKIKLSHPTEEFESIVKSFNAMNHKLSESTVSLAVMHKVVEERTKVLEQLSNTDPLTKVANRRALFERGSQEFSRVLRSQNNLTLMLLDCDLFKEINDQYGHLFGDELLIHVCDVCREEIRDIDFLARYGGEEFIIILPNCDITGGIETAKRIQHSLAEHGISKDNQKIEMTVSIGISMFNKQHKNFEQLINDADQAMYQAKQNGRNRIEVSQNIKLH